MTPDCAGRCGAPTSSGGWADKKRTIQSPRFSPPQPGRFLSLVICNHGLRNSGGIERYLQTLVKALHDQGIKPMVIAKVFDKTLPEYGWVEPVRLNVSWAPRKWRDFAFDWRLKRLKQRGLPGPLVACNQTGAATGASPSWLDKRKIALEREHFVNARVVIAHSQLMKDQVQRFYGVPAERIEVLHPPVDSLRFNAVSAAKRDSLRQHFGLPSDKAVFLLASTGHKRKGLDLLVRFFQATTLPVQLVVAGRPISVQHPNVRYLGYRSDIEDVYRAVDFTVMASSFEPFGLVGVESVLCGTPVLMAQGVGCSEVIQSPAGTTFELDKAEDLERAMMEAVTRWRAGVHRVAEPLAALSYDPDAGQHLRQLILAGQRRFNDWRVDGLDANGWSDARSPSRQDALEEKIRRQ
jgi:glycosyltransferase involved in cell wall biosynthesis